MFAGDTKEISVRAEYGTLCHLKSCVQQAVHDNVLPAAVMDVFNQPKHASKPFWLSYIQTDLDDL